MNAADSPATSRGRLELQTSEGERSRLAGSVQGAT